MYRPLFLALCFACGTFTAVFAAPALDFTDHGGPFGTYNLSNGVDDGSWDTYFGTPAPASSGVWELWADQAENDEWILTAWVNIEWGDSVNWPPGSAITPGTDGEQEIAISYAVCALNKQTGQRFAPITYSDTFFSFQQEISLYDSIQFRPSIAFTKDPQTATTPEDDYDGAVLTFVQYAAVPNATYDAFSVSAHFLYLEPGTNVWAKDINRQSVNVSGYPKNYETVQSPHVVGLDNGDIVVAWITSDPTDPIGGQSGINPTTFSTNPVRADDIYLRRFKQQFMDSAVGTTVPGMVDTASPASSSTINVSNSKSSCYDFAIDTDGDSALWVTWTEYGYSDDNVAGLGTNTGPRGSTTSTVAAASATPTTDVYLRVIDLSTSNTLIAGNTKNVSESAAKTLGALYHPSLSYNAALDKVAVLFFDETKTSDGGGIGGDASVVASWPGSPVANRAYQDAIVRIYSADLATSHAIKNLTNSTTFERSGDIASLGNDGWIAAWTTGEYASGSTTTWYWSTRYCLLDASGVPSTPVNYPTDTGYTTPDAWVQRVTSAPDASSVAILFRHDNEPDNLRNGEMAEVGKGNIVSTDLFLTLGEVGDTALSAIYIDNVVINSGNNINIATTPTTMDITFVIHNTASESINLSTACLSSLAIPDGFRFAASTPSFTPAVSLAAGGEQAVTITYNVDAGRLVAGTNHFLTLVSGTLASTNDPVMASTRALLDIEGTLDYLEITDIAFAANSNSNFNLNTIDLNNAPNQVKVKVTVRNNAPNVTQSITFSEFALDVPTGFTFLQVDPDPLASANKSIPAVTNAPNNVASFIYTYSFDKFAVVPGANTFTASVAGTVNGFSTSATADDELTINAVLKANMTAVFEPSTIVEGVDNVVALKVTVNNTGSFDVDSVDLNFALTNIDGGTALSGLAPTSGDSTTFAPDPAVTTIADGSSQTFIIYLAVLEDIPPGTVGASISADLIQGPASGTRTATPRLTVKKNPTRSGISAAAAGCALASERTSPVMVSGWLAALALLLVVSRRRKRRA